MSMPELSVKNTTNTLSNNLKNEIDKLETIRKRIWNLAHDLTGGTDGNDTAEWSGGKSMDWYFNTAKGFCDDLYKIYEGLCVEQEAMKEIFSFYEKFDKETKEEIEKIKYNNYFL